MEPLAYFAGYPLPLQARVRELLASGRLGEALATRYAEPHAARNDALLREYVQALKARWMRSAPPLDKVVYDGRLQVVRRALGTHTAVSRVQGRRLKASREIRIDGVFRDAPAAFLELIAVHELAHLRHADHDKAFYQLCSHMAPDYAQREFDLRLWLTLRDAEKSR